MNTRMILMAFGLLALSSFASAFSFSGNVSHDFSVDNNLLSDRQKASMFSFARTSVLACSAWMAGKDSPGNPYATQQPEYRRSGMDMDSVRVLYDDESDRLYVGVECAGICGDTDGDGNPSAPDSKAPKTAGLGSDNKDMCSELLSVFLWVQPPAEYQPNDTTSLDDFYPNVIVGQASSTGCLVKTNSKTGVVTQGIYAYNLEGADDCVWDPEKTKDEQSDECRNVALYSTTTAAGYGSRIDATVPGIPPLNIDHAQLFLNSSFPHVEFYLENWSQYPRADFKRGGFTNLQQGDKPFRLGLQATSAATDSCGEDSVKASVFEIVYDCNGFPNGGLLYDACGVCGGDGTGCSDCFGIVNGTAVYDECGVCDGDNTSCADCFWIPHGTAVYDECGVCGGDNTSCADCFWIPHGTAVYDECGVCGGDNTSCADCFWIPHGTAKYDECGVCDGDNTTCDDCFGVPHGPAKYDACGVCDGDNTTCDDCFWVPHGTAKYDECGVCGGDNTSCADCFWIPHGTAKYDACGVCDGDNTTCDDCFGIPHGTAAYDACGVCDGNNSCVDCDGIAFGNATYDTCGVCNGDNSTCVCYKYLGWEEPELCYALLRWSIAASRVKLTDTLDVLYAIKHELPYYNFKSDALWLSQYIDTVHHFCDECLDNFDYAQSWFADRLAGNCVGAHCEDLAVDSMSWQL